MSELMSWRKIPPGATLEVSLTPAPGQFTSTGTVYTYNSSNPPDQKWKDAEVHPGPRKMPIESGSDYIVDLLVSFVSPADTTAAVAVAVRKSDGSSFGKPLTAQLTGKNGAPPDTVSIILVTQ